MTPARIEVTISIAKIASKPFTYFSCCPGCYKHELDSLGILAAKYCHVSTIR